jgi:glycine C-acetyltransferase
MRDVNETFGRVVPKVDNELLALSYNCVDYAEPEGSDLISRTGQFYRWWQARNETGTWQYSRTTNSGINFASQDYLALGQHPLVHEASIQAIRDFGPHSAGSPAATGNTTISRQLETELAEFLDTPHIVLFPTGWAASFGTITGLVREYDYVVMDKHSHPSLEQGIRAATRNVVRFAHLDAESARQKLIDIRVKNSSAGILVVSEGLFSMYSDSPDLLRLQEVCHEFGATLLVNVAHDLGATGPGGKGQVGTQDLLGKIDLVIGSFSKSFASNGGFLATRSPAVKQYLQMYGNPHVFSNALSPVQVAVVLASLRIIRSEEGEQRRQSVLHVVNAMRSEFKKYGIAYMGHPSPLLPVPIGDESVSRIAHRALVAKNISAMNVEYPLVAVGESRFRLQAMASHTVEEGLTAARLISDSIHEARQYVNDRIRLCRESARA